MDVVIAITGRRHQDESMLLVLWRSVAEGRTRCVIASATGAHRYLSTLRLRLVSVGSDAAGVRFSPSVSTVPVAWP